MFGRGFKMGYVWAGVLWAAGFIGYPFAYACAGLADKGAWLNPGIAGFAGALLGGAMFVGQLGQSQCKNIFAIFVSGRNAYSLSQLQMVLWSWIIFSAIVAVAAYRAWHYGGGTAGTALSINLTGDLLSVIGIAFSSAAIVPGITLLKEQRSASISATTISQKLSEKVMLRGQVVFRPPTSKPKFLDFVCGDDVGSAGRLDLGKVQNLLLTLILTSYYSVMICGLFQDPEPFTETIGKVRFTKLPGLSEAMATLLLISHAAYLGAKAAPRPEPDGGAKVTTVAGGAPTPDDTKI